MSECLFCRIIAGELPSEIVAGTGGAVAIRDINPAAPTHVLVMPRTHIATIGEIDEAHHDLLNEIVALANYVAQQEGIAETGYRLVFNNGPDSGMLVPHLHLHLLGGAKLGPIASAGKGRG